MKIVADACSIILLAKSSVLEESAKQHDLAVTDRVYKEVIAGKGKKYSDALLTERLYKEKKIKKITVKSKKLLNKIKKDYGMGDGEASTLVISLKTGKGILTDNRQGRKAAKIFGLKLLGSPEIIVGLFKTKKIDENKAVESLKFLRRFGWFDDYLIEEALREVKNG